MKFPAERLDYVRVTYRMKRDYSDADLSCGGPKRRRLRAPPPQIRIGPSTAAGNLFIPRPPVERLISTGILYSYGRDQSPFYFIIFIIIIINPSILEENCNFPGSPAAEFAAFRKCKAKGAGRWRAGKHRGGA